MAPEEPTDLVHLPRMAREDAARLLRLFWCGVAGIVVDTACLGIQLERALAAPTDPFGWLSIAFWLALTALLLVLSVSFYRSLLNEVWTAGTEEGLRFHERMAAEREAEARAAEARTALAAAQVARSRPKRPVKRQDTAETAVLEAESIVAAADGVTEPIPGVTVSRG